MVHYQFLKDFSRCLARWSHQVYTLSIFSCETRLGMFVLKLVYADLLIGFGWLLLGHGRCYTDLGAVYSQTYYPLTSLAIRCMVSSIVLLDISTCTHLSLWSMWPKVSVRNFFSLLMVCKTISILMRYPAFVRVPSLSTLIFLTSDSRIPVKYLRSYPYVKFWM